MTGVLALEVVDLPIGLVAELHHGPQARPRLALAPRSRVEVLRRAAAERSRARQETSR